MNRYVIVQLTEISAKITGKIMYQLCGSFRLKLTELLNTAKSIVYEMRTNLADHGRNTAFCELPFFLCKLSFIFRKYPFLLCKLLLLPDIVEHHLHTREYNINEHAQKRKQQTGGCTSHIKGNNVRHYTHHQNEG